MNFSDSSRKDDTAKSAAKPAVDRVKIAAFEGEARSREQPNLHPEIAYPKNIKELAKRYIWWQAPEESLAYPLRVIAQVMNLGTAADSATLEGYFGQEAMRNALREAEPGWFRERSWTFWHYRLDLTPWGDEPPSLPTRSYVA